MSPEQGIVGETNTGEFMLFGVRVVVDSMRKSVSLNNLSQYEHRLDSSSSNNDVIAYASADEAVPNSPSVAGAGVRERKRGTPWTEEEHKLFLIGLQKVGKGDWRGIAKNFVKSRTPTQVASHAQKYFLRRSNLNRRRRRSSLFDITTDTVLPPIPPIHEHQVVKENNVILSQSPPPLETGSPSSKQPISNIESRIPTSSETMADFDLNEKSINDRSSSHLSLNLSLSISSSDPANSGLMRHSSGLHATQTLRNGDNMISVV